MDFIGLNFLKVSGTGNDFIVVINLKNEYNHDWPDLARIICRRHLSVGADGLVVLGKSKKADARMRIFNPDGSEAEMCGNAARCSARVLAEEGLSSALRRQSYGASVTSDVKMETLSGIITAQVKGSNVKIKMTNPKNFRDEIHVKIGNEDYKGSFINTGVPHAVFFVEDIDKIDLLKIGRKIRYDEQFKPAGTNVNFVQVLSKDSISIRTYERGVEDETYACGTGAVASGVIAYRKGLLKSRRIIVLTRGGKLTVELEDVNGEIKDVYLESPVEIVYSAKYIGEKNV